MKKKAFTETEKVIYKLGYQNGLLEGQNRFKHSLNALQKTNNMLQTANKWLCDELIWLDRNFPLVDAPDVIAVPIRVVNHLIELLKLSKISWNKKLYYRKRLTNLLHKQKGGLPNLADILNG